MLIVFVHSKLFGESQKTRKKHKIAEPDVNPAPRFGFITYRVSASSTSSNASIESPILMSLKRSSPIPHS